MALNGSEKMNWCRSTGCYLMPRFRRSMPVLTIWIVRFDMARFFSRSRCASTCCSAVGRGYDSGQKAGSQSDMSHPAEVAFCGFAARHMGDAVANRVGVHAVPVRERTACRVRLHCALTVESLCVQFCQCAELL